MQEISNQPVSIGTTMTQPSFNVNESIAKLLEMTSKELENVDNENYFRSERYRAALQRKADYYNSVSGQLIGYNCEKCKNKGIYMFIDDFREVLKDCECKNIRDCIESMRQSGIDSVVIETNTFEKFITDEDWKVRMKAVAEKYLKTLLEGDTEHWLLMSGQSGSGKTHLSTAVCIELMKSKFQVKYMTWNDIVHKAQQSKFNADAYNSFIKSITAADVFYIDDLFKTEKSEKDIAFEILNMRYISKKPTIISTEVNLEGIQSIDSAIAGRISHMCKGFMCQIKNDESRNYRRR